MSGLIIKNIRRGHGDRSHLIYAELRDSEDRMLICATLDYITSEVGRYFPIEKEIPCS